MIDSILAGMDGPGGTAVSVSMFEIGESTDSDGAVRLALSGELDLSGADQLTRRLDDLRGSSRHVRLVLSALELIDSGGVGVLQGAQAVQVAKFVSTVAAGSARSPSASSHSRISSRRSGRSDPRARFYSLGRC